MGKVIIRDLRKKEKYQIDDAYLHSYAKTCGIYATGVYNCLCRHADYYTQECFPSVKTMTELLGISRNSVLKGLDSLEKANIITRTRVRNPNTQGWVNNSYTLLDKSQWIAKDSEKEEVENPVEIPYSKEPCPCEGLGATSLSGTTPSPCEGL